MFLCLISGVFRGSGQSRCAEPTSLTFPAPLQPHTCSLFPRGADPCAPARGGWAQGRDPRPPHSLRSLEVRPWGQVQVLALRHEQALELDGDGMSGAVQAPDGDAGGHQVDQGVVGVELVGGHVARGLNRVAEGPCKHSQSHQPLGTQGFPPLPYLLAPTGRGMAFPGSRASCGLDNTADTEPGQAAEGWSVPSNILSGSTIKERLPSLAAAGTELQPENRLFPHKRGIFRLFQGNSTPRRTENEREDATERKRQRKQRERSLRQSPRGRGRLPAHLSRCRG